MSTLLVSPAFSISPAQAANCRFELGFQTLHNLAPDVVGACLVNEHFNTNGDAEQETANGMMVWRKADNFTAFTDGYHTWVNGPNGVQERLNTERFDWESDQASAATAAAALPEAAAAPGKHDSAAAASASTDSAAPTSDVAADDANAPVATVDSQPVSGMAACTGNYHYVLDTMNGGELVRLMDGSLWRVQPVDKVITMIWSEGDAITLTDDSIENANFPCYLANESDGESANAQPAQ